MAPPGRAAALALLVLHHCAPAVALSLCALVSVEPRSGGAQQLFASIRADGSLGHNVSLTQEALSGMLGGDAQSGRFTYSPPLALQPTIGLVVVDTARGVAAPYPLHNPDGYAGTFTVGGLVASDVPGDVIAVMASADSTAWVCVAELTPADGVPRVRFNLTLEATGFDELYTSSSAFDPKTRTAFVVVVFGGAQRVVAVPLDGMPSASLVNVSFPDYFAMIGITFAQATNSVVAIGLVAPPQVYGLVALSMDTLLWTNLTSWTNDDFYLSGLGEIAVDPDEGRYVHVVLSNAAGVHVIPVVDATTGAEVRRITMQSDSFFVSSLAFCNATFSF